MRFGRHVFEQAPVVTVLDMQPALDAILHAGDAITVNVEYDAGPANMLRVSYRAGESCWAGAEGSRSVAIERGTHGVVTVTIPVDGAADASELLYVKAALLNDTPLLRDYTFGPC